MAQRPIIIDGGPLCTNRLLGVHRFLNEILLELDSMVVPGEVTLVVEKSWCNTFKFSNVCIYGLRNVVGMRSRVGKLIWENATFPHYARAIGGISVDLALGYPRKVNVVAVHDCIRELYPQNADTLISKARLCYYMRRVRKALTTSDVVVTVSDTSRKDLERLYGISGKKIYVICNGWQHMLRVREDPSVLARIGVSRNRYYFSLGGRQFHKNFAWVIAAARQNSSETFVVSGSRSLGTSDVGIERDVPENVIFTGYLTDSEVKALMSGCKSFIFPSLYEGFGIPPLEAMSVGANCIVADSGSLSEVYGSSVRYIDPHRYDGIHIAELTGGVSEREKEIVLGKYSWNKSARCLLRILRERARS